MAVVSETHLEEMKDQGFTILEGVFTSKDMDDLAQVLDGFEAARRAEIASQGGQDSISRANEITFTSHLAEQHPAIQRFVRRPEFVEIATKMLATPNVGLYWNQTVFKHPEGERLFPWHQDDAYTRVEPYPYLTLWLAISDATPENGCVSIMPESHKRGFVEHWQSDLGWVCHDSDDPNQGILAPVSSGSIVAFWSLTMHKSGPNRSKGVRKAYVLQFAPQGLRNMESGETIDMMAVAGEGVAIS